MSLGLSRKSATWYEETAIEICRQAHNQPEAIKRGYESYKIPLRKSQREQLKRTINTRYIYNKTFGNMEIL